MFIHTREALNRISKTWNVVKWIFDYGMSILMIVYLILALVFSLGNDIVNGILLGITALMLVVTIAIGQKELLKKQRVITIRGVRKTKHALKCAKIVVKAYSLGVTLYGMFIAASMVSPLSIIMTTLLIILWVITVIIELISVLIETLNNYLKDSINKDIEELKEEYHWLIHPRETIDAKVQQGREFAQEKYNQGKEFVGEKYNQGVEYAQAIAEQGKTKLDEAKTAVQNFFTKSKKAE